MNDADSFGRRAARIPDPPALITLERESGQDGMFADLDDLLADIVVRALTGERITTVQRGRRTDTVLFGGLSQARRSVLSDRFLLENQRARGAWFVPEKATLKTALVSFPAVFADYPRFASGMIAEERARAELTHNPEGIWIWSVLEPLFEQLHLPLELRGRLVGTKSRDEQLAMWAAADDLFSALRIDLSDELAVMRYGGGWDQLGAAADQLHAKQRLLAALAMRITGGTAVLYRAYRLQPLIARYYQKAKGGKALRRQVLTRPLEKTLVGFFGGDWLGFLRYLGEQPHPDEEINTAIPQIKLYAGSSKTAAAIATEKGLPAEEVKRMLASYWDSGTTTRPDATSPADQRVKVMTAFWRYFDEAHTRQAPGMPSLWGLVEEGSGVNIGWDEPSWYNPRLYHQVLPAELIRDIEQLWASIMLPRWPERLVSDISPHALMADTFGAALQFWHGCALTAWFLSEGPMSRTDMAGLPGYHQDALAELQRLGCPVDPSLFGELKEAEARLGPPQPLKDASSSVEIAPGVSVEINTGSQSRRPGFEILRDIITRHRTTWAKQYLDTYFRARWQAEFQEAARLHAQAIAERGKPPTAKQFARHAVIPANHWLGGDMAALYAAIGEKSPIHPERVALMPADKHRFALLVFERLGGRPFKRKIVVGSREEALAQGAEQDRHTKLSWLAGQSLRLIQLEEATGRVPELKEFGTSPFEYRSAVLAENPEHAWEQYVTIVRAAQSDYSRTSNSTTVTRS